MRLVAQIVLGVLVIGSFGQLRAAETGSRWWPFSGTDKTAAPSTTSAAPREQAATQPSTGSQPVAAQQATAMNAAIAQAPPAKDPPKSITADHGWKPTWPAIHLPEFSTLRPPKMPQKNWGNDPEVEMSRNTWYEEPAQPRRSPWQAVKDGAQHVGQGTRNAWDKTVDALTPGDEETARVSQREEPKAPLWKRMIGIEEEKQQGPRTVTEWMAQERLDP